MRKTGYSTLPWQHFFHRLRDQPPALKTPAVAKPGRFLVSNSRIERNGIRGGGNRDISSLLTGTYLVTAVCQPSSNALAMVILAHEQTLQAPWPAPKHADYLITVFGDKDQVSFENTINRRLVSRIS